MSKPWKQMWKDHLQQRYADAAERWKDETHDDRLVFVNVYRILQEALDSLPDEPHNFVACAVVSRMRESMETLDSIAEVFKGR